MRPIRWLHISDFHIRVSEAWSQDVVLSAMCEGIAHPFLSDRDHNSRSKRLVQSTIIVPGLGSQTLSFSAARRNELPKGQIRMREMIESAAVHRKPKMMAG